MAIPTLEPTPGGIAPPRGIALFDLDGTLLPWDCQLLFCHRVLRRDGWRRFYLPVFLMFTPLAKVLGSGPMKRIFLSYLWRMPPAELAEHAREFARELTFYPSLVGEIERHRREGNLLVLTSASPEFYVTEIGTRLGFDLSLGTPVETEGGRAFFPELENHKGAAKVERLKRLMPGRFGDDGRLRHSHGYTDSTADLPLLAVCESATLVNPSPKLAKMGAGNGWAITRPERPWRSKFDRLRRIAALVTGLGRNPAL